MRRKLFILLLPCLLQVACNQNPSVENPEEAQNEMPHIDKLIAELENSNDSTILVVSHRGDWRNAPENSLQAIQNCIDMGVDMVEIDVQMTKDSVLVLMHDKSIDRTTTGKGLVSDFTYDSLQYFYLKDGLGHYTPHKIPTLEEALLVTKDKILVNLDKSYEIFAQCFEIAQKTATLDQVVIKGSKTRDEVEKEFGQYLGKVYFMPIVRVSEPGSRALIDDYLTNQLPVAFEFTVPHDTIALIDYFDDIRARGASVWVNSLWPPHNGGHDDEKAALDPSVYDWYIENNIDLIQTDRPAILLQYLRQKGRHD